MHRLTDAEIRVMEVLWQKSPQPAGDISRTLQDTEGWNRNTTYTLIKRCIEKHAITRQDPGFLCSARITRDAVRREEAGALMDAMFEGSREVLFASLLGSRKLNADEAKRLHALIDEASAEGGGI